MPVGTGTRFARSVIDLFLSARIDDQRKRSFVKGDSKPAAQLPASSIAKRSGPYACRTPSTSGRGRPDVASVAAIAECDRFGRPAVDPAPGQLDRLISIQHALVDVIEFLDPDGLRFPGQHLARLPSAGAIVTSEPGPAGPAEPAADAGTPTQIRP